MRKGERRLTVQKGIGHGLVRSTAAFVAALLFLLLPFLTFATAESGQEQGDVVRVGFPIQEGLTEMGPDGSYSGYTVDYLAEIAQYTDWQYEFVRVEGDVNTQIATLLAMLSRGEIDLMGAMTYSETLAEQFEYAGVSYGTASSALCVLEENVELNRTNYMSAGTLRVIVPNSSGKRSQKLDAFADVSGFAVEQVFCTEYDEQLALLEAGKADAVLTTEIGNRLDGLRILARFSPQPFYFAATKGNKQLIGELNAALTDIEETNAYFSISLMEKYSGLHAYTFYLTETERAYVEQAAPLRVAMLDGMAPLQYLDDKTGDMQGVSRDVLDRIAEKTGLTYTIVPFHTYSELEQRLAAGDIDLIAGIPSTRGMLYHPQYRLTVPYVTSPVIIAVHQQYSLDELAGKRLALWEGYSYGGQYQGQVVRYENTEQCLEAVHNGEADYCYGNSYTIQYYLRQKGYQDINAIPQTDEWTQRVCFGIVRPFDKQLLSVLNKAVLSIPDQEMQTYLYAHSFPPQDVTLERYINANPWQFVLLVLLSLLSFTVVLLAYAHIRERRDSARRRLENERYEQLSELTNEFLFTYDIVRDRLVMSEQSARFLGCARCIERLRGRLDRKETENDVFACIAAAREGSEELLLRLPDGARRWLRVTVKVTQDEHGAPVYAVGRLQDIQQEHTQQEELLEQAQKDGLTGVYHAASVRRLIAERREASSQGAGTGAFLILDIDHYKQVNDTYGHYVGDLVLKQTAQTLLRSFRQEDVVGRLGGDEFMVYLSGRQNEQTVSDKCAALCEQLRRLEVEGRPIPITVSIGAALSLPEEDFADLYRRADETLYSVKRRGRNGFAVSTGADAAARFVSQDASESDDAHDSE